MSLVPDYGSSSSNDEHSDQDSISDSDSVQQTKKLPSILPSASALLSGGAGKSAGVVFNNPYKDAENAKIASLEKHVKMVATEEHTQIKNGKKICWNYRKGRCRFGSNCTFAHDSDLHKSEAVLEQEKSMANSKDVVNVPVSTISKPKSIRVASDSDKSKKRPGLSNTITPSKKVMKHYNRMINTSSK